MLTDSAGHTHWTANARDAELHLTQQTAGNGIVTIQSFDQLTGRLAGIVAGTSNSVESLAYAYDRLGNMLTRQDANTGLAESFSYDSLNRLTASSVSLSPTPLLKTFAYDPIGSLVSKSDVGDYTYPAPGSALPHAVTSIAGGSINTTFRYDGNGNQTAGLGRNVVYTSYNKPASITQGAKTIAFSHDVDHQRFMQTSPEGNTIYLDAFGVRAELFVAATSQWNEFLSVGGTMVGMRILRSDQTVRARQRHQRRDPLDRQRIQYPVPAGPRQNRRRGAVHDCARLSAVHSAGGGGDLRGDHRGDNGPARRGAAGRTDRRSDGVRLPGPCRSDRGQPGVPVRRILRAGYRQRAHRVRCGGGVRGTVRRRCPLWRNIRARRPDHQRPELRRKPDREQRRRRPCVGCRRRQVRRRRGHRGVPVCDRVCSGAEPTEQCPDTRCRIRNGGWWKSPAARRILGPR
jgi:hypothetical protein